MGIMGDQNIHDEQSNDPPAIKYQPWVAVVSFDDSNFTRLERFLIISIIRVFFWILNWMAKTVEAETPCSSKDSSSIIFVGKCSSAIAHRAIIVRKTATSFVIPRGASADKDWSVFKSCFCTVSESLASSTLKAANKRPSTNSGPPKLTCWELNRSLVIFMASMKLLVADA